MDQVNSKKQALSPEDKKLFVSAMDEFNVTGNCSVKCNQCNSVIRFERRETAILHECDCGKFTGSLRGF
ncbi:hypothetical protein L4D15_01280 [Enterovibrio norvegicus]|uniref:hypothetical protein n=1 Tax=Enterovibrio norvegicus TaxID=188144 RepID=UPI003D1037B5